MDIVKADGTREPFDENKLRASLMHSEASHEDIEAIVNEIKSELKPGMRTDDIYRHAFEILKQRGGAVAARYSMRKALAQLGPSGYPFEHFLGQIFEHQGYSVEVGVLLPGKCVDHEIDVIAKKDNECILVEAKFHNHSSVKSDLKTALYVAARYDDLNESNYGGRIKDGTSVKCMLITNTKFTSNAIRYAKCRGIDLVGWTYPHDKNLSNLIEEAQIHPVTALTTLSNEDKKRLTDQGVVLCKNLRDHRETLSSMGMDGPKVESIMKEVNGLCHL